jgi:hypothetical protein
VAALLLAALVAPLPQSDGEERSSGRDAVVVCPTDKLENDGAKERERGRE